MLIATDLDGTLGLGSRSTMEELFSILDSMEHTLVYVTGRDIKNFRRFEKSFYKDKGIKLRSPDFLVALNGAKIYDYKKLKLIPIKKLYVDKNWPKQLKPMWSKKLCRSALRKTAENLKFGNNLPAIVEVQYKQNPFYLESVVYHELLEQIQTFMETETKNLNIKVHIIFDYLEKNYTDLGLSILDKIDRQKANIIREMRDNTGGVYVMMPSASNKGFAVEYIRTKLDLKKSQVIAAGDGGNDYHLLTQGYKSIIVNNANPILLKKPLALLPDAQKENFHYVSLDGAAGLIEGIKQLT